MTRAGSATTVRSHRTRSAWGVPFLGPAIVMVIFVVVVPSIQGILYSFTNWSGIGDYSFVGLQNYTNLFKDPLARSALAHTLMLTLVTTLLINMIGLGLALGLNTALKTKSLLRLLYFAPVILTPVVVANVWKFIYLPDGPLNAVLGAIGLKNLETAWLGDSSTALWAVTLTIVWQFSGISMVIYLAGLQGVPDELLEAAELDGAGPLRRLVHIALPMLRPSVTVSVLLAVIGGLKTFDQVWVMTEGGPGDATQTLSTAQYQVTFVFGNFSYGATFAVVIAVLAVSAALAQQVAARRRAARDA